MQVEELFDRFPGMKPVDGPPSLSTVNGFGLTMYGKRDFDPATGTYVKTHWFALLFLPVLAVGAYRVADAPGGGWYFLGKVPVSQGARNWTFILVALLLGVGGFLGWSHYTGQPEYQAKQRMREAEQLRSEGRIAEAAAKYYEVAAGETEQVLPAVRALEGMTASEELRRKADPKEMAEVFQVAWKLEPRGLDRAKLFEQGKHFAEARADDDPASCLAVVETVELAGPDLEAPLAVKQRLLEKLLKARADDVELLSKLAVVFERSKQRDRCEKLLVPHVARLGASEGARVLGQLYAEKDKLDEAHGLLQAHVEANLKKLKQVEEDFKAASDRFQEVVIKEWQEEKAAGFDYKTYKNSPAARQQEMTQQYLNGKVSRNLDLAEKFDRRQRAMAVVPAVFDLGLLQLRRAQRKENPKERQEELENAEKTFLSVQSQAGRSAEFKLRMGEVKYWMGKQAEGKKLFDEILKADGRKYETLMLIGNLYRDMGAFSEARPLFEEAHRTPGLNRMQRNYAAHVRGITQKDLEDAITWLEKMEQPEPESRATLVSYRGNKLVQDGREDQAVPLYRETIDLYSKMKESSASLNNCALVCQDLFAISGDRAELERGVKMLEKAAALAPRDAIVMSNLAEQSFRLALGELVADKFDLKKLRRAGDLGLFDFLADDEAARQTWVKKVRESAAVTRTRGLYDRALIVAPKSVRLYSSLQGFHRFHGDLAGMRNLLARATESKLDLSDTRTEYLEFYQGKKDERSLKQRQAAVARAEKTLKEARESGGLTFAVAAVTLVEARIALLVLEQPVDLDALVALAEEANKAAPSEATSNALVRAHLARASAALSAADAEFAAIKKRTRRALGGGDLVAVALWRGGKTAEATLANPDVKRAIELVRDLRKRFPSDNLEWSWALLKTAHPEDAAVLAKRIKEDELARLDREMTEWIHPLNPIHALRTCWALDSAGKSQEALAILKRCRDEKLPVPFDIP